MINCAEVTEDGSIDLPMIYLWYLSDLTGIPMGELMRFDLPAICQALGAVAVIERINDDVPMMYPKIGFVRRA